MADVPTLRLLRISPRLEAILHDRKVVTMRRYIAFLRAINVGGHTVLRLAHQQRPQALEEGGLRVCGVHQSKAEDRRQKAEGNPTSREEGSYSLLPSSF